MAGDQVEQGQYFSYPGRRFQRIADEWLHVVDGWPVVPDAIAWLARAQADEPTHCSSANWRSRAGSTFKAAASAGTRSSGSRAAPLLISDIMLGLTKPTSAATSAWVLV